MPDGTAPLPSAHPWPVAVTLAQLGDSWRVVATRSDGPWHWYLDAAECQRRPPEGTSKLESLRAAGQIVTAQVREPSGSFVLLAARLPAAARVKP